MNRPANETAPNVDQQLIELIERELLHDDRVSAQNIKVTIDNEVATLRGQVTSYRRKLATQKIVAAFDGIRDVRNELVVEPACALPDDEIASHLRAALDASADIVKETIVVDVVGGKATLTGTVGTAYERAAAEDIARGVRGVRDVVNMLQPSSMRKIDDYELMNSVQAALGRARGLKDADIRPAIAEDTIVLSGTVDEAWKREVAVTVVGRFGFMHVRNEIQID